MPLNLITPPSCLPLSVADVRQHFRQDITDDDNLIAVYLGAAVEFAQMRTQRQFVCARWQYVLDAFPGPSLMGVPYGEAFSMPDYAIKLPKSPLVDVVSIQYTGMDGNVYTMAATDYKVDFYCDPPRITPVFGKIWPITLPQIGSVKVTFDAGYMSPVVANPVADTVTVTGWGALAVGATVRFSNSGGALPSGLVAKTDYAVASVPSAGVYTLSAGGVAVNLTDVGTGLSFVGQTNLNGGGGELPDGIKSWLLARCDSHYSYRGEMVNSRGNITPLPFIDYLLDAYRVVIY